MKAKMGVAPPAVDIQTTPPPSYAPGTLMAGVMDISTSQAGTNPAPGTSYAPGMLDISTSQAGTTPAPGTAQAAAVALAPAAVAKALPPCTPKPTKKACGNGTLFSSSKGTMADVPPGETWYDSKGNAYTAEATDGRGASGAGDREYQDLIARMMADVDSPSNAEVDDRTGQRRVTRAPGVQLDINLGNENENENRAQAGGGGPYLAGTGFVGGFYPPLPGTVLADGTVIGPGVLGPTVPTDDGEEEEAATEAPLITTGPMAMPMMPMECPPARCPSGATEVQGLRNPGDFFCMSKRTMTVIICMLILASGLVALGWWIYRRRGAGANNSGGGLGGLFGGGGRGNAANAGLGNLGLGNLGGGGPPR